MADSYRKLIIVECRPIHTGRSSKGSEYTIYDVKATREDHTPLDADKKLRSFQELALNVPADFIVERFDHPQYGESYTLKPKDDTGKAPTAGARLDELAERLAKVEASLQELALRVYGPDTVAASGGGGGSAAAASDPPAKASPPPPATPPVTHTRSGDIPF